MANDFNIVSKRNLDVMKVNALIFSLFLVYNGQMAYAGALSKTHNDSVSLANGTSTFFKKITPEMLYGYTDFNFSSAKSGNFNRFKGHSNLYSAGADHLSLSSSIMAGLYFFRIETALTSQFLFLPGSVSTSKQTINNDTIFGHVLKIFSSQIYADISAGYGFNKLNTYTQTDASTINEPDQSIAHARNNNSNWFVSFNGIYRKAWQKFLLRTNVGVLYSQIDTKSYYYQFPTTNTFFSVKPLLNKATLIIENAEVGYFINPKLMPFINAGLIQVAQFSNSRALVDATTIINGSLPQLNMDKGGFRLGGGISYTYKNVSLRIEEKYYNAGGTFQSYESLASLEYQFN